jgi:large subunit ribosomal protein L4
MLEIPVYNTSGEKVEDLQIDESVFGGEVNVDLLKQAVLTYQAHGRQGTARTKSRSEICGTTKKMYRQKGTGNARHGNRKAPILRSGGHAFAKRPREFGGKLPKKMRRAALRSAILAKALGGDLCVLDGLEMSEPKTKELAAVMANLKINRRCLLALGERNKTIYLSSRNLPDVTVRIVEELNACDVATRPKLILTRQAIDTLTAQAQEVTA